MINDLLKQIRDVPLDQIPTKAVKELLARVVKRPNVVTVDVARFNSSI